MVTFALVLLAFAVLTGTIAAAHIGFQSGQEGASLLRACLRGWLAVWLYCLVVIAIVAILGLVDSSSGMDAFMEDLAATVVAALLGGLIFGPICLVPGGIAAFISYNFGAQGRAQQALAQLAPPPIDSDPPCPP